MQDNPDFMLFRHFSQNLRIDYPHNPSPPPLHEGRHRKFLYLCSDMAKFRINILGCGSATPSLRHLPACQVIDFRDRLMMVDCGEGAQLSMRRQKLKFSRLRDIFISHLHGDHFLGLPGLLSTMSLQETGGTVTVHIFEEGAELISNIMKVMCGDSLTYNLNFNIITPERKVIMETPALTVTTAPLYHRVDCVGFIFREKPKSRHIIGDMARFYDIPHHALSAIKDGADFVCPDGKVIPNSHITTDADPAVSYGYASDTAFDPRVVTEFRNVDTLYHEATYADDRAHLARPRGHSTARQAGIIARRAGVKRLILGHFSKSYLSEELHTAEASEEFGGEVICANEGMKIDLI